MYDLVLKNGLVVDGTRKKPYIASVCIKDGRISEITDSQDIKGQDIIDCTEKIISPGFIGFPPPTNEMSEIVWWGFLKGLAEMSEDLWGRRPDTLYILVNSRASSKVIRGRMVGSLFASMVFPLPGVPAISRLCAPQAAISIARLTLACPFTSLKSMESEILCENMLLMSTV